jgi:capsular exopolysaccharide synthesis family protein
MKRDINLITISNPKDPAVEAYKMLRTNIQFSSLRRDIKTILVTSGIMGEGKSSTAANLAVVMAQNGKKTILIDCDQRKPSIHRVFKLSNTKGLSDLLIDKYEFKDVIQNVFIDNLHVITSGKLSPNPSELISSKNMQNFINMLKGEYEYIILDTPPVTVVTDAQILSRYVDGCVLVVSSEEGTKRVAVRSRELLSMVNARILGVVLNKVKTNKKEYSYSYYQNKN